MRFEKSIHSVVTEAGERKISQVDKLAKTKQSYHIPGEYLNLGMYLVVPMIVCTFVGVILDAKFGTKSFFTLCGIGFGTISLFYNLFTLYKKG